MTLDALVIVLLAARRPPTGLSLPARGITLGAFRGDAADAREESMSGRAIEKRHGFPGALRAWAGGVRGGRSPLRLNNPGGHVGAPHVVTIE